MYRLRFAIRYAVRWVEFRDHGAAAYLARLDCRKRLEKK